MIDFNEKPYILFFGDCLDTLKSLPDNSISSICTDPPYGLSFMGKKWDYDVPSVEIWEECLRVLKPGGHLLAFAGTRTQHRMAVRIEDAGFEIRDMIAWVYGVGMPKSLDVSKAIDKAAGVRGHDGVGFNVAGIGVSNGGSKFRSDHPDYVRPTGITEAARQWQGWGTALKPSLEPITVARKPLVGTVAANVLQYGTGGINIDGCRVGDDIRYNPPASNKAGGNSLNMSSVGMPVGVNGTVATGRWPANLIHDGSDEVCDLFPDSKCQQGVVTGDEPSNKTKNIFGEFNGRNPSTPRNESGSAARFFYSAKVSKKERNAGLPEGATNNHPTVKPISLMRYLCRLVTPPGGTVLDPFTGSGSTGVAAIEEGFNFVGCEMTDAYIPIATARLDAAVPGHVHDYSDDEDSDTAIMPVNAGSGPTLTFE